METDFLEIRDNNTKTARERKSWQYYDMMEDLFENDACFTCFINGKSLVMSIIFTSMFLLNW
jgi:hypothetical protein